jgi:hypothetical protein
MNRASVFDTSIASRCQPRMAPPDEPPLTAAKVPAESALADDAPYLVTTCTLGVLVHDCMTAQQVLALDTSDVDFHHDAVFGKVSIRLPNGELRQHIGEIPGLGPDVGLPFLEDIMWSLGQLLTEQALGGSLRHHWKTRNARDRQVVRLRQAFGDNATAQHYFIVRSRPWRIAWNTARSWRMVERR